MTQLHEEINELENKIKQLQNKLHTLKETVRAELNKQIVGKFYKEWHDTNDPYTQYTSITNIDEFGNLMGYYIIIYDDGYAKFHLEREKTIFHYDFVAWGREITKEEFDKVWEYVKLKVWYHKEEGTNV